ncbi:copper resistance protein NlpE [Flavobacterium salilacus subsp. salilacus]|uniref:hypothetical protein n=1 Tax=Flavobacterium TaxID=237 RepID=UPI0010754913|nr:MULTISPECIES: hypothetical protein [Flavobacterium]KAF2518338.1 copper resistance protein NlpE [Flavobacterium salilacus subsp. salilacus]MBE1615247.1 hypothetical protein [Flavobacterium sp. SaA2.13]
MKKVLMLLFFAAIAISCTQVKRLIEAEDIVGKWKEVQGRKTKNSPVEDIIVNCNDSLSNGDIFFFNTDGTYLKRSICPDRQHEEEGTWVYRNNIISLTTGKDNIKFSVSDAGKNKIKLSSLLINIDGTVIDDFDMGFFVVLEKQ